MFNATTVRLEMWQWSKDVEAERIQRQWVGSSNLDVGMGSFEAPQNW